MNTSETKSPLLLRALQVAGYRNLTSPIHLEPLGTINVIHCDNSIGKANVLEAMDEYSRCMAKAKADRRDKALEANPHGGRFIDGALRLDQAFTFPQRTPISMTGTFSIVERDHDRRGTRKESEDGERARRRILRQPAAVLRGRLR
ncbi:MAG: hypothetical protein E3J64_01795 [Anaerolineales bacterium]|nr:MAG: hypothetical protein E3J64_01795 [Anaerolineales bacterium]